MGWDYAVHIDPFRPYPDKVTVCKGANGMEEEYVRVVRCMDCVHSTKDGTLCRLFAAYYVVDGEFQENPSDVEPDGFCAWGERMDA